MSIFETAADTVPKDVKKIIETYVSCYSAKLAVETITNEILKGDLVWSQPPDKDDCEDFWPYFIKKLILHLNLFGYAVYRYVPKRKRTGNPIHIAPPEAQSFVFTKNRWIMKSTNSAAGQQLKGTKYWKTIIMNAPERMFRGADETMEFTSAGWRSLSDVQIINSLEENILRRDEYNSAPMVYTEISPSISGSGTQRPWFSRPNSERSAVPIVPRDFNTVVEERAETIAMLDEITDETRQRARERYSTGYQLGTGGAPPEEIREHKELIVSDGRKAAPVPFLRAPEECYRLLVKYEHRILFQYGVPPQTIGENINSERNAASSRLADVSLDVFETTCNKIRHLVNKALHDMSVFVTGNDDMFIQIRPCVSKFKLAKLEGILKPSAAKRMYACAYSVSPDDIDSSALKLRIDTINAQQGTQNRVENATIGPSKNRPVMSTEQKSFRDAEKSFRDAQ